MYWIVHLSLLIVKSHTKNRMGRKKRKTRKSNNEIQENKLIELQEDSLSKFNWFYYYYYHWFKWKRIEIEFSSQLTDSDYKEQNHAVSIVSWNDYWNHYQKAYVIYVSQDADGAAKEIPSTLPSKETSAEEEAEIQEMALQAATSAIHQSESKEPKRLVFDDYGNPHESNTLTTETDSNVFNVMEHEFLQVGEEEEQEEHSNREIMKYFAQRYRLFSRFDDGIQLDRGNAILYRLGLTFYRGLV